MKAGIFFQDKDPEARIKAEGKVLIDKLPEVAS